MLYICTLKKMKLRLLFTMGLLNTVNLADLPSQANPKTRNELILEYYQVYKSSDSTVCVIGKIKNVSGG